MARITQYVFFALLLGALVGTGLEAQTINAASCNETDVLSALASATAGSTVIIPSCPAGVTWTTAEYWTAPANFTLQGQTSCTGSGSPTSPITCTDNTLIIDGIDRSSSDPPLLQIATSATGTFRMTGITFGWGGGVVTDNGSFRLVGSSLSARVDHIHFLGINALSFVHAGAVRGVFDHILLDGATGSGWRDYGDTTTVGNTDWAAPTGLGTSNFMFFENSTLNNASNDCQQGGHWVVRFNTFNNNGLQTHPTGGAGQARGCRAWEVYQNTFQNPTTNTGGFNVFFLSSGTGVIWGNTASSPNWANLITIHSMRRDNSTYTQAATPNGWGYCGTTFNGTGSAWDQNLSSGTGHHCLDQPGQGQGDLLTGYWPNLCDSTSGQCAKGNYNGSWPNEALEPVYEWQDTFGGKTFLANYEADAETQNADFYLWCNASSASGCTSFNGTVGVGSGTLALRPSTCTPGVAYWASDQGSWNTSGSGGQGELFKCTSTNTWTLFYTPYTYPHPLDVSGATPGIPVNPQAVVQTTTTTQTIAKPATQKTTQPATQQTPQPAVPTTPK